MGTTGPEGIRAPPMPQVVILPTFPARGSATHDSFLIEKHFNRCQVLFQVPRFDDFAGELGGVNEQITLRRGEMFVTQVLFQFKNRERFLGIVEHGSNGGAGTMTSDLPTTVLLWDACFPAQKGDEGFIDVSVPDALASIRKEKLHRLTGFGVDLSELLLWPDSFPLVNALADERVNRFGVRSRGFVYRDIQKAGGIFGQDLSGLWHHDIFILPAHTSHPQSANLVVAQRRKAPDHGDCADQFQWIDT